MTPTSVGRGRLFQMFFVRPDLKKWQKPSKVPGTETKILSTRLLHYTRERQSILLGGTWKTRTTLMSDARNRREMSNWEAKGAIEEMKAADDKANLHCERKSGYLLLIRTRRCSAFGDSWKPVIQTSHLYHTPGSILVATSTDVLALTTISFSQRT